MTKNTSIPVYFDEIKARGYVVKYSEWMENHPLPKILLIISPLMMDNYNAFGDAVSFDITYKVCNVFVVEKEKEKYWNLGVFSVFIEDCRPVICGVCLMLDETINDFCSLFHMFR